MKKFWAFLVVGLLIGSAAWAVDVQISAIVASRLSVGITDSTWDLTIDNTGAEVTQDSIDNPIDNLTVISSKKNYTVSFSSSDNGNLKMTVSGTDYLIPYKIKVDTTGWAGGVGINQLSDYVQLSATKTIEFIKRTPAVGKVFPIGIQIPEYEYLNEIYEDGTYTATLTIGITAP